MPRVKRTVRRLSFFALLLCATNVQAALRWGADAEGGAPYVFRDPKNAKEHVGFEVDIARALSKEIGEEIVFKQYDFKSLLLGINRGDIDFAMNGIELTQERKNKFRMSVPYYVYEQQLVIRRGDARCETLDACKEAQGVIGTLEESMAERLLDAKQLKKRIYEGQVEPYKELALGRIDAVLLDLPIAVYYAQTESKLSFAGPPFAKGYYAIAFKKDNPLANRIDEAIRRLGANGELKRIYQKWRIDTVAQDLLFPKHDGVSDASPDGNVRSVLDNPPPLPEPTEVLKESKKNWTIRAYGPLLLDGAWMTIKISVLSMILAMLVGVPLALLRSYAPRPMRVAAIAYIEFFRGVPVLLILYFLYYGLPVIFGPHMMLSPMQAAVLGFGLNYAAFEAEVYRSGLSAIPKGQWEAAYALGLSRSATFFHVIAPQAIRTSIPAMTNDFVALFKDTSIVSTIAVVELAKQYQILTKSSMKYVEIGFCTALLYLAMSLPLAHLARKLEARWSQGV